MMLSRLTRSFRRILLIGGFLLFWPSPIEAKPLMLGTISPVPSQEINKFQPLARYLETRLSDAGIHSVRIVIAKNIPQMASFLKQKKVDIYMGGPFPSVAVSRLTESRLLLQGGAQANLKHSSVVFVRTDSGLKRLKELKGKNIAFSAPFSTFGYWLPKSLLEQKGFLLALKKNFTDPISSHEVGYVFTKDDENTLLWVLKGKAQAGAIDQVLYKREEKNLPGVLRVVEKTISLPPRIVSIRKDLADPLAQKIQLVFESMDESEEGKLVLERFDQSLRFERLNRRVLEPLLKEGEQIDSESKRQTK